MNLELPVLEIPVWEHNVIVFPSTRVRVLKKIMATPVLVWAIREGQNKQDLRLKTLKADH